MSEKTENNQEPNAKREVVEKGPGPKQGNREVVEKGPGPKSGN